VRRSRRRDERLRAWADELYQRHGPAIAALLGREATPPIGIEITSGGPWAASTSGRTVTLNRRWFEEHPDDAGGCLHEFAHAVMEAPGREGISWLVEGIADYVRDVLGFDAPWTTAHFEPGGATAGYQSTAHFLLWLDRRCAGAVTELARRLSAGRYHPSAFVDLCGTSLEELTAEYEGEHLRG
jgi:hypothetical protein